MMSVLISHEMSCTIECPFMNCEIFLFILLFMKCPKAHEIIQIYIIIIIIIQIIHIYVSPMNVKLTKPFFQIRSPGQTEGWITQGYIF